MDTGQWLVTLCVLTLDLIDMLIKLFEYFENRYLLGSLDIKCWKCINCKHLLKTKNNNNNNARLILPVPSFRFKCLSRFNLICISFIMAAVNAKLVSIQITRDNDIWLKIITHWNDGDFLIVFLLLYSYGLVTLH